MLYPNATPLSKEGHKALQAATDRALRVVSPRTVAQTFDACKDVGGSTKDLIEALGELCVPFAVGETGIRGGTGALLSTSDSDAFDRLFAA